MLGLPNGNAREVLKQLPVWMLRYGCNVREVLRTVGQVMSRYHLAVEVLCL